MKSLMFGVAVISTAAVLSLSPIAAKANIFVGACSPACPPGAPSNIVINDPGPIAIIPITPVGAGWIISGSVNLTNPPPALSSNLLTISFAGPFPSTLAVFVTGNGVSQAGALSILSSMQVLQLPLNWTATESTYADINNGIYTTVTPLAATGTVNGGPGTRFSGDFINPFTGDAQWSVTEVYTISASGPGTFQGNITMSAVPGPVVGAGLPGLIAACGGLIALARRRRKIAVAA